MLNKIQQMPTPYLLEVEVLAVVSLEAEVYRVSALLKRAKIYNGRQKKE